MTTAAVQSHRHTIATRISNAVELTPRCCSGGRNRGGVDVQRNSAGFAVGSRSGLRLSLQVGEHVYIYFSPLVARG